MQLLGLNPILSSPIVPPSCHWNATHNNKYFLSGGGPKRFHDSFNFVFYIVGECISCAADTHLAMDLTC